MDTILDKTIVILLPNGEVITMKKKKGLEYHIDYLAKLSKENKYVKNILQGVDFDYYAKNSAKIYNELISLFQMNGCVVLINLAPNIVYPTNAFMAFMSSYLSSSQKDFIEDQEEIFRDIEFYDIVRFDPNVMSNVTCLEEGAIGNYESFFNVIDNMDVERLAK